eukprot:m.4543 g.4543  ORF g.4543 m.4543 type:complete len:438 (+) comp10926_c0_seq2:28-1341(+)
MGQYFSRNNANVEEAGGAGSAYRYPSPLGAYFGSRFQLGNEWFDTTEPESYLFGDNHDLNFLGRRPSQFPYPAPSVGEPTKTIRSLINIRKDTLKLVRNSSNKYHLQFVFDSDVKCTAKIYVFAVEDTENGHLKYKSKQSKWSPPCFSFKRGSGQVFVETDGYAITPDKWNQEDLSFNRDKPVHYPLVIHMEAANEEDRGHSHSLIASIEKSSDGCYTLKPVKQKQMIDGCLFILQEIYGLENKDKKSKLYSDGDDDIDEENEDNISQNGIECVICMGEPKDTLFLPCRHLCVCHECAESLREQSSSCPICRQPFKALLCIEALKRNTPGLNSQDGHRKFPKYISAPLIEALDSCSGPGAISSASPLSMDSSQVKENAESEDDHVVMVKPALSMATHSAAPSFVDVDLPGTPVSTDAETSSSSVSSRKMMVPCDEIH